MFKMTESGLESDLISIERMSLLNQLNALKLEDERFENELRILRLNVEECKSIE